MGCQWDNGQLNLKDLTLKLTMFLALTTVSRGSELSKLNPRFLRDFGGKVVFQIVELTKTKRPAKPHLSFILHKFEQDTLLDVIACLETYIKCTKLLRRDESRKCSLLISYTKPHRPVVACSIARWLKAIMTRAGIDTSISKRPIRREQHQHRRQKVKVFPQTKS